MSFGQLQSSHLAPATMGEDSMEISSDNGHSMMGDDIDIDIDIGGGPVDEDYVIEDAQSDIDFNDSFDDLQGNNHPQNGDDDLMADDDHHSLSMNDVDVDPDEDVRDAHEETVDITEEMMTSNMNNNEWDRTQEVDQIYSTQDDPNMSGDHPTADEVLVTEELQIEPPTVLTNNEDSAATIPVVEVSEPAPVSEQTVEKEATEETLVNSEDFTQVPSQPEESLKETTAHIEVEEQKPIESSETIQPTENSANNSEGPVEPGVESFTERKITVIYQDTEYELFSSTDADHPDLFFLEDRSMIHEPLPTFLAALKDVIHEEASAEDELCLAVDELGIELSETSTNISELTFSQVLDLYDELSRNDGVTTPSPVHVTIGLRPDFAKKFASLRTSASEGKGLSQLVATWDEGSESLDEQEQFNLIEESEIQEDGYYEDGVDPSEITGLDESEQKESQPDGGGSNTAQNNTNNHEDQVGSLNDEVTDTDSFAIHEQNTGEQEVAAVPVPTSADVPAETHDIQEGTAEGDLLDYSEDEEDVETAPAKSTTSGSPAQSPCEEADNAEYQAKEEELRRRSISIVNEEVDTTQEVPSGADQMSNEQISAQEVQQTEEDDQFDHPDNEGNQSNQESSGHAGEELTTEDHTAVEALTQDDEFDNTTFAEHGEDTLYYEQDDEQDDEQDVNDMNESTAATNGDNTEIPRDEFTDIPYQTATETDRSTQETRPEDFDSHLGEEDQSSGSVTVVGDVQGADEIDYNEGFDVTEPTMLEPIIEEQAESLQKADDDEDEINYDDEELANDDHDDELQAAQSPSSVGKRRRSSADEHDEGENENQDAKRLRS